ncbi:hypothetical protein BAE44_0024194 [Dichanthelium oligosanthes]|uniref:Uncharacterized protein n=1 Tax=Dichanthelium oligosanthes TaxID=888268 RepID=A0A1E5UPP9_9POAL|nr:hypothetical protein BAE44_0024194 [Dichanthelium oligosanthes]
MGDRARSPGSTTCTCRLLLAMALVALAVTAAHGARTWTRGGPPPGHGGGTGAGSARRSALDDASAASRPVPSCCTHDRSRRGSSCCPQTLTP